MPPARRWWRPGAGSPCWERTPQPVSQALRNGWANGGIPHHSAGHPCTSPRFLCAAAPPSPERSPSSTTRRISTHAPPLCGGAPCSAWRYRRWSSSASPCSAVRLSVGRPLRHMTQWLRELRTARCVRPGHTGGDFEPLAREVTQLATSLSAARAAAQEEARLRDTAESTWTTERLRVFVEGRLGGTRLFAVSNREPYEHRHHVGRHRERDARQRPGHGPGADLARLRRNLDRPGHRRRRPRHRGRRRPRPRAARSSPVHAAARLAHAGRGTRLLLRVRQRGHLAALPHRPHAPGVSRRRLAALPRRQPQIRRCAAGGNRDRGQPRRAGAGLPLRAASRDDQGRAARRARGDLLAHSLAQSRGLRDLPLAARTARRTARRRPDRISHSGALQQLSGHRGPRAGIAHRMGALCGKPRRPPHAGPPVPDQRRPGTGGRCGARSDELPHIERSLTAWRRWA